MMPETNIEPRLEDVTEIVRQLARVDRDTISAQSDILVELDFDSLQLLELTTVLKERYAVDFLDLPEGMRELRSAETIAEALRRELERANVG